TMRLFEPSLSAIVRLLNRLLSGSSDDDPPPRRRRRPARYISAVFSQRGGAPRCHAVSIDMPDREIERVRMFTRVMDTFGLDPILGFVLPGAGDLVGAVLGLYIVVIAIERRVSKVAIARMLINLGIDMIIGVVPVPGDAADILFKANE